MNSINVYDHELPSSMCLSIVPASLLLDCSRQAMDGSLCLYYTAKKKHSIQLQALTFTYLPLQ